MNQTGLFIDGITEKLEHLRLVETPNRAKKGLAAAGEMLAEDAIHSDPAMPVDTTSLIGSGTVFVDGVKTWESPYGVPGTQTRWKKYAPREYEDYRATAADPPQDASSGVHEAQIAFNAPYAAAAITTEDKGDCLSSKIGFFLDKYMDAIYDAINLGH